MKPAFSILVIKKRICLSDNSSPNVSDKVERLKYMHMIENGCSINYIQNKFGQTFYATFENGIETRTSLDESNGNAVLWSFI